MKERSICIVLFCLFGVFESFPQPSLEFKSIDSLIHKPTQLTLLTKGYRFLQFEKTYFGKLEIDLESETAGREVLIRYGEKMLLPGVVDTRPGGTIRSGEYKIQLEKGRHTYRIPIPKFTPPPYAAKRAVSPPEHVGDITPFRYVEIIGYEGKLTTDDVRRISFFYPFNDNASFCQTSSTHLNQIWKLCKHSVKATTYAGLYVDGDRERQPYEGDTYINQLSHYAVDSEYALTRATIDHLFAHPTWPTEWPYHMHMILWEDYMYTGRIDYLERYYNVLKEILDKSPLDDNGLVVNIRGLDIIDWPQSERDGYTIGHINNVPNAFYNNSLRLMSRIASLLGRNSDADRFGKTAEVHRKTFDKIFWNSKIGLYRDAADSLHTAQHACIFPIAFGMASDDQIDSVRKFLKQKGMSVSVYGAQYLLDALYEMSEDIHALSLITATGNRSWINMLEQGSTITWEAWNSEVKPNLDWNHAWGTAPANIIARRIFGIRPLEAGFSQILYEPHIGGLTYGTYRQPTIQGDIVLSFSVIHNIVSFTTKANAPARLLLSSNDYAPSTIFVNGQNVKPHRISDKFFIKLKPGTNQITIRTFLTGP